MRILGIDPGTVRMGYGAIEESGGDLALVEHGVLQAPAREPIERRLWLLYQELQRLIHRLRPGVMAVEEPFVVPGPRKSALAVGEARAIALLAAAGAGLPVAQYNPTKVRSTVADYGGSDKEQVRQMVTLLLGQPMGDMPLDASDALAVAICHVRHAALDSLLGGEPAGRKTGRRPRSAPA